MKFNQLPLTEPLLKAVDSQGYTTPTPIQQQAIPILLNGEDLLGTAQTGTGKTAAFAIPIIQMLNEVADKNQGKRKIKALVVTPTRELAIQIKDSFSAYGKFTHLKNTVIFGGVKQGNQTSALNQGVDILIATPGRLLDLINQGFITLKHIEYFVLDEADQMLDMGFIHDIKKLIKLLPHKRQSLFFSATMSPTILALANEILGNPKKVSVAPKQTTAEKVDQLLYYVNKANKPKLLVELLKENPDDSTLVFSRTKHGADKIVKILDKQHIVAEAIHGNKSQNARQRALSNFKDGKTKILIATDIAARGIDVDDLGLVVNFDLPNVPETYVHRIGRTGRASASGKSISFCDVEEKPLWKDILKLIQQDIEVNRTHLFADDENIKYQKSEETKSTSSQGRNNRPKPKFGKSRSYSNRRN